MEDSRKRRRALKRAVIRPWWKLWKDSRERRALQDNAARAGAVQVPLSSTSEEAHGARSTFEHEAVEAGDGGRDAEAVAVVESARGVTAVTPEVGATPAAAAPTPPDRGAAGASVPEQGTALAAAEGAEAQEALEESGDAGEPVSAPTAALSSAAASDERVLVLRDSTVAMHLYDFATREALATTARELGTDSHGAWHQWFKEARLARSAQARFVSKVLKWGFRKAGGGGSGLVVKSNIPRCVLIAAETRLADPGTPRSAMSAEIAAIGEVMVRHARQVLLGQALDAANATDDYRRAVLARLRALCTVGDIRGADATVPVDSPDSVERMAALDAAALLLSSAVSGGGCDLGAATAAAALRRGSFDVAVAAGRSRPPAPCPEYAQSENEAGPLGGMRGVAVTQEYLRSLQRDLALEVRAALPAGAIAPDGTVNLDRGWVTRLLQLRSSGVIDLLPFDIVTSHSASAAGSALVERITTTLRALREVSGALDPARTRFVSRVYGAACRSWVEPLSASSSSASPPARSLRALSRPARDPSWQADIDREVRDGSMYAGSLVDALNQRRMEQGSRPPRE